MLQAIHEKIILIKYRPGSLKGFFFCSLQNQLFKLWCIKIICILVLMYLILLVFKLHGIKMGIFEVYFQVLCKAKIAKQSIFKGVDKKYSQSIFILFPYIRQSYTCM